MLERFTVTAKQRREALIIIGSRGGTVYWTDSIDRDIAITVDQGLYQSDRTASTVLVYTVSKRLIVSVEPAWIAIVLSCSGIPSQESHDF